MRAPNSEATPGGSADAGRVSGELAAIDRLRRRLPGPPADEVWIGDDAAVLSWPWRQLLLTTDLAVAGVHADLDVVGIDVLGWRALAGALSDVAAMGGRADQAVVGVAGPPDTDLDLLYEGIDACARAHGCALVGGDLSGAPAVVVSVTVTGHVPDDGAPGQRDGARPGDHLFVTGPVGGAAAGLRALRAGAGPPPVLAGGTRHGGAHDDVTGALLEAHCRPVARLSEGDAARRGGATAMVDVSDGLLSDLWQLADASGVGFALARVPVFAGATLEDALGGGEDYELVFAAPHGDRLAAEFARAGTRRPVMIGACTADVAERTLDGHRVERSGWEHPWR